MTQSYLISDFQGFEEKATLGDLRSPLLQLVSIRCCLMYALFHGLWVKPGLTIFLFLKSKGSSIPEKERRPLRLMLFYSKRQFTFNLHFYALFLGLAQTTALATDYAHWATAWCLLSQIRCMDARLTLFPALFPPQQVVFCQDAPVATRLCSLKQVLGLQEWQHIQSQLLTDGDKYVLLQMINQTQEEIL